MRLQLSGEMTKMEIEQFKQKVKQAKLSIATHNIKVYKLKQEIGYKIVGVEKHRAYLDGTTESQFSVKVLFHKQPEHLTIFEAQLLYCLFALNRKPSDYAGYHNCQAGKEFIENIREVQQ